MSREFNAIHAAKMGRPVKDVDDLLSRPEWKGSSVERVTEYVLGPEVFCTDRHGQARVRAVGPRNARVETVDVVRHPCGAEARLLVRP